MIEEPKVLKLKNLKDKRKKAEFKVYLEDEMPEVFKHKVLLNQKMIEHV